MTVPSSIVDSVWLSIFVILEGIWTVSCNTWRALAKGGVISLFPEISLLRYQRNIDLTTLFDETLTTIGKPAENYSVLYENPMSHNFIKRLFWKKLCIVLTANATGQRILMTNCEGRIFFFKNFSQQEEQFERQMYRKFKVIKRQLCWRLDPMI